MNGYNDTIPICFATDEGYLGLTTVAIQSVVDNSSKENYYDIHIFHNKISQGEQEKVVNHFSSKENINIVFDDVNEFVKKNSLYTNYEYDNVKYTEETYYRFLIPEILKQYEKVIYLDGDVITLADVKELYDIDIGNNLLGAARDLYGIKECKTTLRGRYVKNKLKINNCDDLFIAGILIINNNEFNKQYDWKELLSICSSYKWRHHDQDVLNMICNKKTKLISPEWGLMPLYHWPFLDLSDEIKNEFQSSYKKEKKLIHYGGYRKPWKKGFSFKSKEFWIYASRTPYFNNLLDKCKDPEIRWLALVSVFGKNVCMENDVVKINKIDVYNLNMSKIKIYDIKEKDGDLQMFGFMYVPWLTNDENIKLIAKTKDHEYKADCFITNKNTINNSFYEKNVTFSFTVPIKSQEIYSLKIINHNSKIDCIISCNEKWIKANNKTFHMMAENGKIKIEKTNKIKKIFARTKNIGSKMYVFIKKSSPSMLLNYIYYGTHMILSGKGKMLISFGSKIFNQ